ncbi:legume-type lectin and IPT/TiG domain protein [Acrasis kona]|uniref:Legume-type lectin and IPT/TiG domain protein n=1 Tax=Acrasis kona TaxID=1008807 RepID=A0AAW2YLP8_9EUKA
MKRKYSGFLGRIGIRRELKQNSPPVQVALEQSTRREWILLGSAKEDTHNNVIHLTEAVDNQKGAAIYRSIFNWKTVFVEFEYKMYSYGADGICFFMADADRWDGRTIGQGGGALCYCSSRNENNYGPGMDYGYLGVGFDVYGGEFSGGNANSVTVRGPGIAHDFHHRLDKGHNILYTHRKLKLGGDEWRKIRIRVDLGHHPTISVFMTTEEDVFKNIVDKCEIPVDERYPTPNVYKFGICGLHWT